MPRQAYVYIAVILIFGALGVPLTASHLKASKDAANALAKVKQTNLDNAAKLDTQRKNLDTARAELTQANLGWDQGWDVDVRLGRGQLNLTNLGTNAGFRYDRSLPKPILHGFTTIDGEMRYVGPFQVVGDPGPDSMVVKPYWPEFRDANGLNKEQWTWESAKWRDGKWRFLSLIPAGDKRRFEGLAARAQSAIVRFDELKASVDNQAKLQTKAEEQAERRLEELLGSNDPNAELDPLRPELTVGLNKSLEDEEEARNALALEIDAMRRAILEQQQIRDDYMSQLKKAETTSSAPAVPRLGARPKE